MNPRKQKAAPRGPVGSSGGQPISQQQQAFVGGRYNKQQQQQQPGSGARTGTSDNKSLSASQSEDGNKSAPVPATDSVSGSSGIGVYQNARVMHTITSLIGSLVQVAVKEGVVYEGILKTFSPEFEIAIATATEIDPRSPTDGQNIGHLIRSLANNQKMSSLRIFPISDVVTITVLNTDMDFALRGFETDEELSRRNRIDASEERELVPWSADEPLADGHERPLEVDNSNGWTAEEMFEASAKRGGKGFQNLDLEGTYTIALKQDDNTPESREKHRRAEAIAREIEGNVTSKRRVEQENSDDRTEEEQFSAVVRSSDNYSRPAHQKPGPHVNTTGNRSDDLNWRQQSNRNSQQSAHSKPTAFSGRGSFAPAGQQHPDRRDRPMPTGPKGQRHQQTPPHHSPHQQHVNQSSGPHQSANQQPPHMHQRQHPQQQQQQQAVNFVASPPVSTPNEDISSKTIASSSAPPTPPNYAKVVAEDGSGSKNAKLLKKKEEMVSQTQPAGKQQATASQSSVSSPGHEKREPVQPVREKNSPTEVPSRGTDVARKDETVKKEETPPAASGTAKSGIESEQSIVDIAKNSKLNPNAKEFTLNPAAKPFTPRSQQPPAHQPQHVNSPPVQYSNSMPQNVVAPVHHIHHQHYQQQPNPPQMMPMQAQAMPRMQNQQVLLHQMVAPGGNVFPYPVFSPSYQQQVPISQSRPGKQNSKYQNSGNRNDQYNQNSPHNVATATGHPVLATAPISYQQQPGMAGAQIFQPVYPLQGFNPRMQVGMVPQVQYDPASHMYLPALPVQVMPPPISQQNNGPHSNPSTPQSQTPTTPGLHGGPPTPGPAGHPHQGQTPTPQQSVMYTGQNMNPQQLAGAFNGQGMLMMQQQPHQQPVPHQGVPGQQQPPPHAMAPVILSANAPQMVMSQHYQQGQPPPPGR